MYTPGGMPVTYCYMLYLYSYSLFGRYKHYNYASL